MSHEIKNYDSYSFCYIASHNQKLKFDYVYYCAKVIVCVYVTRKELPIIQTAFTMR